MKSTGASKPSQKPKLSKRSKKTKRRNWKPGTVRLSVSANLTEAAQRLFSQMKPAPRLTMSQWADRYRKLSREDSAEPGRWKTSRAEFQRGIMDAMSDPTVKKVVVIKGSQIGWTAIIGNAVGYFSHQDPASILVLQPTVEMAEAWSKERLAPMIRDTPALSGVFPHPKSRGSDNTLRLKMFPGGYVAMVGANAPAGLASRPIRIVLPDETDRYPASAGTEGDPIKLAEKRQTTFWNRKLLMGSTPTVKGESPIEREFEESDMRRFHVPCPHCGESQSLKWSQVKWDKEDDEHFPATAHYCCEGCGVLWSDAERWAAVSNGEWIAEKPFAGIAGFHLSQLYSPWVSLEEVVQEFVNAQGRPELLQVWVNTVLGETWEESGEKVDAEGLKANVETYDMHALPEEIILLTAGVDTQGDRLECEIVGWGFGEESWGVRHHVLYGDPAEPEVWKDLDDLLLTKVKTEDGRELRIVATAVDAGGHHAAEVHRFCRARFRRRVYAIRGMSGPKPIWPPRASKTKKREKVWMLGVDTAKESLYGRFGIKKPGPGYCHFSAHYEDEWFEQATSEKVVTRYKNGRAYRVWIADKSKRQEGLDCRVYALAAMKSLSPRHLKNKRGDRPRNPRPEPVAETEVEAETIPETPTKPETPPARPKRRRRRSGWIGNKRKRWL